MDDKPASADPAWVEPFLAALRDGHSVAAATRMAKTSSSSPYDRRKHDAAFRAAWEAIGPQDARFRAHRAPRRSRGTARLDRFLEELAATSNVAAAAAKTGVNPSAIYKLRRSDPAFARRWYAALAEGYDNLEMELLGRLRAGDGGDAVQDKPKFDTAAALRCLAAHRESVAREKGRRTLADEVTTIEAINAKIDQLRRNGEAGAKAMLAARKAKARARKRGGNPGA